MAPFLLPYTGSFFLDHISDHGFGGHHCDFDGHGDDKDGLGVGDNHVGEQQDLE